MADQPIRSTVSALSAYLVQNLPGALGLPVGSIDSNIIQGLLSTYVALYSTAALPLTAIQPDYESNVAELQSILNNSPNPAWTNTAEAATGQTLIEMIATAQAYNQFSVERALQESMLDFAQLPSSIYEITRLLGVRIARCSPASMGVTFTLSTTYSNSVLINSYTQFNVGGINFFNRNQILFPVGSTTASATLYQGTVNTATFYSNGQALQTFSLTSPDFTISDQDIAVYVNSSVLDKPNYSPTEYTTFYATGLWEYGPADTVYYQSTDVSGNATITFGDGNYGVIPPINAQIVVTYATTLGANGNLNLQGSMFNYSTTVFSGSGSQNITIMGTASTSSNNGSNQRLASEYKIISPGSYSAKVRPSTLSDYNAFALNYSGVIDAYFQGQASFAPDNLNYMMVVQVAILPSSGSNWSQAQFQAFTSWLSTYAGANLQFIQLNTVQIPVNITANIFCTDQIPLSTLENLIIANLTSLFTPRAGFLGYSIYMSDIVETIINSDPNGNIQYVQLQQPSTDQIVSPNQFLSLGTISLNMQVSNRASLT